LISARRATIGKRDVMKEKNHIENDRRQILTDKRIRRLKNISIKLDPAQIQALRKIATMRSIPYQSLIRQWLAEGIRKEFHL
jgi:predicted DNA binding CopG/RHH family protein